MVNEWMPRKKFDAMVRGEDCPLCREIASEEGSNEYGYTVTDLSFSRLRLCSNQYVAGYCVLICHKHVREPYELSDDEYHMFFNDLMRAGKSLETVYKADKMNFEILGNAVPHVHGHIVPRYYGDSAPHRPIDPEASKILLAPEKYEKRVVEIRRELDKR